MARLRFVVLTGFLVASAACQAPAPPPTPTSAPAPTTSASPAATASAKPAATVTTPSATAAPVRSDASRVEALAAANERLAVGRVDEAVELYERVLGSPPSASETEAQAQAIDAFAQLRLLVAFARLGQDDRAREQLEQMQARLPDAAVTRLAAQFWHAYGQTGSVEAACANLQPEIDTQLGAQISQLQAAGLDISAAEVCAGAA